jgi:hypothetical protein
MIDRPPIPTDERKPAWRSAYFAVRFDFAFTTPSLPSPQLEEEDVEEPPKHDHDNDAHHHPLQDIAPGHCESPRALRSAFLTMLNASSVIEF